MATSKSILDDNRSIECAVCLDTFIYPTKLPCGHIFCFLCVKALKNHLCAMCRADFPDTFLQRPELLMPMTSARSIDPNMYQWFYQGRTGWWQFDERTSRDIENAHKNGDSSCAIFVCGQEYVVDFGQMMQQNKADPTRKRQVKRDLAASPKIGVAGLRLPNTPK